jgi:hypothetical protein
MFATNNIGDKFTTHTGGLVTITRTGLIHEAGKGYGGMDQDDGAVVVEQPKRGRGRPRKAVAPDTTHLTLQL